MFLNGEDQYQDHLRSKRHRLNMGRFGVDEGKDKVKLQGGKGNGVVENF